METEKFYDYSQCLAMLDNWSIEKIDAEMERYIAQNNIYHKQSMEIDKKKQFFSTNIRGFEYILDRKKKILAENTFIWDDIYSYILNKVDSSEIQNWSYISGIIQDYKKFIPNRNGDISDEEQAQVIKIFDSIPIALNYFLKNGTINK